MWSLERRALLAIIITILLSSLIASSPLPDPLHTLYTPGIVYDGNIADAYDFVIVGGGLAGLVLASRLSEDSNTTVLVLEAGDTGDAVQNTINTPGLTFYSSLVGSSYDWNYNTVPQPNLAARSISWPRGKVLGGSSAINGLYLVRPSEIEINAWQGLISPQDGAAANRWGWNGFFSALKKSETFDPPSDAVRVEADIQYNVTSHGTTGPLHNSYPGYVFPVQGNWSTTLAGVGIPTSSDPSSGQNWGSYITTSSINSNNWTRSYSRSAYIDPLPPRTNLAILPNATVTRIIFSTTSSSGNLTASAVEYASTRDAAKQTVNVRKEVILAGGSIGSPQILMLSGVGPKDVLDAAGITVQSELPGVGQHLQDHLSASVTWNTTEDTAGSIHASGSSTASTPEFLSYVNSATGYANISTLLGPAAASTFQTNITNALSSSSTLVPFQSGEVLEGYKAIYNVIANTIMPSPVGQVELLLNLVSAGTISIIAAVQHPFSQGRVYINSSSVFDPPVIDPNYLSHFADLVILREGLKFARKIGQTAPLSSALGPETVPGSGVNTDAEWEAWLLSQVRTEFHPAATCAMLPKSQGGVVNANLQVYGLANVRVADASVYPFAFSAHLGAPTYGLAEQAANIIRTLYNGVPPSNTSSSSTPHSKKNGGVFIRQFSGFQTLFCTVVLALGHFMF